MTTYLYGFYVIAAIIFIVMQNRRPQATFAWILLFLSAPGVGVLIYVLFGGDRNAFSRQRKLVRQDLPERLSQLLPLLRRQHERALGAMEDEAGAGAALAKLVRHTANSAVTTQNRAEVLEDAAMTYPRLIEDIEAARSSVHLQVFSWSSDVFGQKMKSILLAKVAEGVQVRVLYDPVGSFFMLRWRYIREMRRGGVQMFAYSPIWRLHAISYRNHRKIFVIDGNIGYTGGLNIGHEHIDPGPPFSHWRDTHLRIVGAAASALQVVFAVDWRNAVGEDLLTPSFIPPTAEDSDLNLPVQITLSGPDSQWRAIRQLYFGMILAARRRVCLQSPFFILDESISEALKTAALKGVDVRIMLSERGTNQYVPYWAAYTYMAEVAAAGARVFLFRGGYLHAKTISIDGEICSIGSANIDIRSFSINYELNAVIYDAAIAGEIERAFERDLARCMEFQAEAYRKSNRLRRLRDSTARLFSPLL